MDPARPASDRADSPATVCFARPTTILLEGEPAPERVGPYRVVARLGEGGSCAVFAVRHERTGHLAALKLLRGGLQDDPTALHRFLYEAKVVNDAPHPGCVQIFDCGALPDGTPYVLMERLDGRPLSRRMFRRPIADLGEVLRLGRQLALTLAALHEAGVVHRDVKPDNIMIVRDPLMPGGERVKLIDFGIAKTRRAREAPQACTALTCIGTQSGVVLGTPAYMAPEQILSCQEIDGKADVYALGVVLYEMLSGRPPFQADTSLVLVSHLYSTPTPLRRVAPKVPRRLATLVHAMLAKSPRARPGMHTVAEALRLLHEGPGPERLWASFLGGGAAAALLLALSLSLSLRCGPRSVHCTGPGGPPARPATQVAGAR